VEHEAPVQKNTFMAVLGCNALLVLDRLHQTLMNRILTQCYSHQLISESLVRLIALQQGFASIPFGCLRSMTLKTLPAIAACCASRDIVHK